MLTRLSGESTWWPEAWESFSKDQADLIFLPAADSWLTIKKQDVRTLVGNQTPPEDTGVPTAFPESPASEFQWLWHTSCPRTAVRPALNCRQLWPGLSTSSSFSIPFSLPLDCNYEQHTFQHGLPSATNAWNLVILAYLPPTGLLHL